MLVMRWDALAEALKREEKLIADLKTVRAKNRAFKVALRWIIIECASKEDVALGRINVLGRLNVLDRIKNCAQEVLKKGKG